MALKIEDVLVETRPSKFINGKRVCPDCELELERSGGWQPIVKRANYEYVAYKCPKCDFAITL